MKRILAMTAVLVCIKLFGFIPAMTQAALCAKGLASAGTRPQAQTGVPIRTLANLEEIRICIGGNDANYSFGANHSALTERLAVLDNSSYDMRPASAPGLLDSYDIFYSDLRGTHNPDGEHLTIEAVSKSQAQEGGSGEDRSLRISVDSSGNAYVTGDTDSIDFPANGALQSINGGGTSDLFIAKISSGVSIHDAAINGKKLIVTESGFDPGAKILLNGQAQETTNEIQNPATTLIGKKAGKKVQPGDSVILQVRNSDGRLSNEFIFKRPQ